MDETGGKKGGAPMAFIVGALVAGALGAGAYFAWTSGVLAPSKDVASPAALALNPCTEAAPPGPPDIAGDELARLRWDYIQYATRPCRDKAAAAIRVREDKAFAAIAPQLAGKAAPEQIALYDAFLKQFPKSAVPTPAHADAALKARAALGGGNGESDHDGDDQQPVEKQASAALRFGMGFDLDRGEDQNEGADVIYDDRGVTGADKIRSARAVRQPTYEQCLEADYSDPGAIKAAPGEEWLCLTTDQGHVAAVRVQKAPAAGAVAIRYIVWAK